MKLIDWIGCSHACVGFDHRGSGGAALNIQADGTGVSLAPGQTVLAATTSTAGVMSATDKTKLDGLQNTLVTADPVMFQSRAQITATTITDPQVLHIRTAGYAAAGDGGAALYRREAVEPAHPGKVQSADGAWWEIVPEGSGACPEQFGAVNGEFADNAASIQDWLDYLTSDGAVATGGNGQRGTARGTYGISSTVTLKDPDNVHVDARGSRWTLLTDTLMFDLNGRADPTYQDNESRQNFSWIGGEYRCNVTNPISAAAFRMLGMRQALLQPYKVERFNDGLILGGKDTITVRDVKFFSNDHDIIFPPWSQIGATLVVHLENLHHSHNGKSTPCVKSYVPLSDSYIWGCSYNLGSNADSIGVDITKHILLGVISNAGNFTPGETITGGTSGATMVVDDVYDHAHPFQIAQNTRWLVGSARVGNFAAGEVLTGGTSGATATIGANAAAYISENQVWKSFFFGGTPHFETGGGANGATGVRLRDRVGSASRSQNIRVDMGSAGLNGGMSIGLDLQGMNNVTASGFFVGIAGDTAIRLDPDCTDISIARPFDIQGGVIDLNGLDRDELDMSIFNRAIHPTAIGVGGSFTGAITTTLVDMSVSYAPSVIAGVMPKAYDLRVSMSGSTASTATNVRLRCFETGTIPQSEKQNLQIAGNLDSDFYWQFMRVHADANGDWEYDGLNLGGGTVFYAAKLVGLYY